MKKYFNTHTKNEMIPGIHFDIKNTPSNIVQIDESHDFFKPENKNVPFDESAKKVSGHIDYKAVKWAECKQLRSQKINADLEYNGALFQMDEASRENLKDQKDEGETVEWRLLDNTSMELTPEDVSNILSLYRQRKQMLYVKSWEVESTINSSGNPKDLDIPTLYNEAIEK